MRSPNRQRKIVVAFSTAYGIACEECAATLVRIDVAIQQRVPGKGLVHVVCALCRLPLLRTIAEIGPNVVVVKRRG